MREMQIITKDNPAGVDISLWNATLMHVNEEGTEITVNSQWDTGQMIPVVFSSDATWANFVLGIHVAGTSWADADDKASHLLQMLQDCEIDISDFSYNLVGYLSNYSIHRDGLTALTLEIKFKCRKLLPVTTIDLGTTGSWKYQTIGGTAEAIPVTFEAELTSAGWSSLMFGMIEGISPNTAYAWRIRPASGTLPIGRYVIDGEKGTVTHWHNMIVTDVSALLSCTITPPHQAERAYPPMLPYVNCGYRGLRCGNSGAGITNVKASWRGRYI